MLTLECPILGSKSINHGFNFTGLAYYGVLNI